MKFRNFPYWLKGGLIGLIIGVIVFVILFFTGCFSLINCPPGATCGNTSFCIQALTPYILLGLITGLIIRWIYGKIKSKKAI